MSKTKKPAPKAKAKIIQADASEHVAGKFMQVDLKLIDPSKTNPRKHFDEAALKDLADSIDKRGVLSPILVRPVGKRYELVAGERRFRASKLAGLKDIPARVADLDDKAVLEVQVIENLQRTDLSPIEEAESYAKLVKSHGYTVEVLAAKIGKSQSYVHKRMKLAGLAKQIREAVAQDVLPVAHAILLARIPDQDLQLRAFKSFHEYGGAIKTIKECAEIVSKQYMLHLSKAPFDTTSLTVLPSAGSCSECQFRTGNQKELFDDVKSTDICTQPTCYNDKVKAWWKSAETKERKLSATESAKLYPYEHSPSSLGYGHGYVDLSDTCYGTDGKTYDQLVGDRVEVFLALDRAYRVHRLAVRQAVDAAIKRHPDLKRSSGSSPKSASDRKYKLERARDKETITRIAAAIEEQFKKDVEFDKSVCLRLWLKWFFLDRAWTLEDFLKARGIEVNHTNREAKIVSFIDGLRDVEVWGVIFSIVTKDLLSSMKVHSKQEKDVLASILDLFSVDHKGITKEVKAEFDAKEKARAEKEKLKKAKAKKAKKAGTPKAAPKPEPAAESEDDFEDVDEEIGELEEVEE